MPANRNGRPVAAPLVTALLFCLLIALAASGQTPPPGGKVASAVGGSGAAIAPSASTTTPPAPPAQWPNLDVLTNYPNPSGDTCGIDGAAQPGTEKARLNRQKNRYRLPQNGVFEPVS